MPSIIAGITATLLAIGGVVYLNVPKRENAHDNKPSKIATNDGEKPPLQKINPDKPKAQQSNPTYLADIRPIFGKYKCYDCHDSTKGKVKGDLDLEEDYSRSTVVDKKKPDLSRLILRLTDKKDPMPPKGPMLSSQEINTVITWMRTGAMK